MSKLGFTKKRKNKVRGSTKGLTLRKGKVEEKPFPGHYLVRDIFDDNLITTSISGRLRMNDFDLEIGEIVYVVVSVYDKSRGILAIEGHRGGLEEFKDEKEILDRDEELLKNS